MNCPHCGAPVSYLKATCEYCGAFLFYFKDKIGGGEILYADGAPIAIGDIYLDAGYDRDNFARILLDRGVSPRQVLDVVGGGRYD